jgi:hypothetical protein
MDDEKHLGMLRVFYFAFAAVVGVLGCLPIVHVVIGIQLIIDPGLAPGAAASPFNPGWVFVGVGVLIILVVWSLAAMLALTGRFLGRRTNYMFCFVIAIIVCLNFPLGTALGVFTLVVLNRPGVKELFGRTA